MVTSETTKVLAAIISFGGKDGIDRWIVRMSELFARYASAKNLETQIIS
jgi:hypothetical protein